jgi:HEAT repeat protein
MRPLRDEIAVVGLLNSLKHTQNTVRRQAVRALSRQDLDTSVTLRQLGRALADPDSSVRVAAVQGLERCAASAVPLLIEALDSDDRHVRREAAWALSRLGPAAEPAVGALGKAVLDGDRKLVQGAIRALGNIGPAAEPAIGALVQVLSGSHFVDGRQAAWALGRIGVAAVPWLIEVIQTGDLYSRAEAVWSLMQMGADARDAVGVLTNLLHEQGLASTAKHPGEAERNGEDDPTATVLIRPRHGTEDAFWSTVIMALGEIGPDAFEATPVLSHLRKHGYGTIQVLAERALSRIDPAA